MISKPRRGITHNGGCRGVITLVTGRYDWNTVLRCGIPDVEVYWNDLTVGEIESLKKLARGLDLNFPLRRLRVHKNIWLYLGDDDRLGEETFIPRRQRPRQRRRGFQGMMKG